MPGELAARWPIVRDLARMAAVLPRPLAARLGRLVIRGRFEWACEVLAEAGAANPRVLASALAAIEGSTSLLASRFQPVLEAVRAEAPARTIVSPRRFLRLGGWGVGIGVGLNVVLITVIAIGSALSR